MSSDERSTSDSASEHEDVDTTGLVATRAKRSTAGNLYSTLIENLDNEEIQSALLDDEEGDEDDAGSYEGSDRGDDDEAMESSSDEEDAGPPKEGEAEDLEGEQALKKAERAEARKKRKVQDAKMKLPAFAKKRVKLADDVKTEDDALEMEKKKKKKKSERANWLPTAADAPTRQSGRSLAVANREVIHANLKQSYERSEKQRRVMRDASEKEKPTKRMEWTPEQRLEWCAKIAKQTDREFGRWEREEKERQRLRDEALAAKRQKGLDGPYIRHWSGSVLWEGDRIRVKRVLHGSNKVEDITEEPKKAGSKKVEEVTEQSEKVDSEKIENSIDEPKKIDSEKIGDITDEPKKIGSEGLSKDPVDSVVDYAVPQSIEASSSQMGSVPPAMTDPATLSAQIAPPAPAVQPQTTTTEPAVPWLQGIHDYASQPPPALPVQQATPGPAGVATMQPLPINPAPYAQPQQLPMPSAHPVYPSPSQPHAYTSWPPGSNQFAVQPPPPAAPSAPLVRQQAQRSLVILEQFEQLDIASRRTKTTSALEPTAPASIILPDSYPPFDTDETRYLTSKHRKRGPDNMPPAPEKPHCAIIPSETARFRDPKTGLPYYDIHTYKMIQRVLAGGCSWSSLLGAWVGPAYGGMGRPAKGVPDGFVASTKPAAAAVKVEGGDH